MRGTRTTDRYDPTRANWLYRFFRGIWIPFVLRFWTRLHVEGYEHVPTEGPLIVISNHLANLDTYIVGLYLRGRVIHYMARPDGLRKGVLGWYWRTLGGIPADREGVAAALRILRAGGAVGIYPEGVISPALVSALPGSALLAIRSGARVVPAAMWGTECVGFWSFLKRPRVHLRYGPPRVLRSAPGRHGSEAAMNELMREIATMLPERYRGVHG